MKIGIYFTAAKNQGGIYQYSITFLEALSKIPGHKYSVITVTKDVPEKIRKSGRFEVINMVSKSYKLSLMFRDNLSRVVSYLSPKIFNLLYKANLFKLVNYIYIFNQRNYVKVINDKGLDLMLYPSSSYLSFLAEPPSITAIHDIMHRVHPQFKEVSAGGRWESREYGFQNICKKSFRILVDSEVGKEDAIRFYKPNPKKVVVLPFLPPSYLETEMSEEISKAICKKLKLPDKFIFYPANFWPHKNHKNLVKAINILRKQNKKVNLVLTGSTEADFSTYKEVTKLIKKYELGKQVFYLGYVDEKQISALYKRAQAMVMPTFFGPTNIPVLEAWVMGTPVVTSDIRGCRDQLGDAGLLVNPGKPSDIANKVWKIYNNEDLRKKLSVKGRERLKRWTFNDFFKKIDEMIKDFELQKHVESKNNQKG